MKVPFSWLQEYIDGKLEIKTAAEALTMVGLEVGSIEEIDGDPVLDMEITPNRSDCLSIFGVARELKAIFKLKLKKPTFEFKQELKNDNFVISIENSDLCYRYAGRIIKGLKVTRSPEWLKVKLEKAGIRSINNVVDVTNYVLLEYGHPLHAFDLDLLEGYCIRVGTLKTITGKDKEEIETLDGVKRTLGGEDLLIWDGNRPVAIAGIMGGANTEVTERTTNILIESAYFKPESVRKTSKRLGLSTEASYRFERGTDIENLITALNRATYLIQEVAGGDVYELIDVYANKISEKEIFFNPEKIRKFIGINIKDEKILEILNFLDIKVIKDGQTHVAKVPIYRHDLSIEEDIAEEVARIYGYDKVPAELPQSFKPVKENYEIAQRGKILSKIRDYIITLGFSEAVNMSFMSPEDLNIFEIPEKDQRRQFVPIINPLRQEESVMRTMLIPGLLKNIEKNSSRGIESIKLFEIGRVFISQKDTSLPFEPYYLAMASKREELKSLFNEDNYDFYALKGVIEGLLRHLNIKELHFKRSSEPFLHSGQSADIYHNGEKIGFVGVLSPKVLTKFEFKTKPYICFAELNLQEIIKALSSQISISYKPLSNYPPIKRDTAVVVSADFEAQKIFETIRNFGNELIEEVYIFDLYKGKGIPEGKQSIAFRITYRAFDRTLTSEEVDSIHTKLVEKILSELKAELRI